MLLRTVLLFLCASSSLCATLSLFHMKAEETPAPDPTPVPEAVDGDVQEKETMEEKIEDDTPPSAEEKSVAERSIEDEKEPETDREVQEVHAAVEDVVKSEEGVSEGDSRTEENVEESVNHDKVEENVNQESVSQDKVEESVSQEKIEENVTQEKVEESVIQEKVEENVIQEKVEENVSQEKVEENVIQEKVEENVIQEKVEENVSQEKVEENVIQEKVEENVIQEKVEESVTPEPLPVQDNEIKPVHTEEEPKKPEERRSRWSLNSIRNSFQNMNGYFDSLVELVGGRNGVCQYRCRYGEVPAHRPGFQLPEPNGCSSSLVGFQMDLGIPAMTQCCNQLDSCYDTCGTSKYDCDSSFRSCLHDICSNLKKSLGLGTQYQTCESMADGLFNTVWTLGCRPYMNSQRAACICEEEERDEL